MKTPTLASDPILKPLRHKLRGHWPEYLIEAWGLGVFMVSAGLVVTLLEYPGSPLHHAVEAPLSGMSMNPARSFASAAPAGHWSSLWLYFTAPLAGMLAAVEVYRRLERPVRCAKLDHGPRQRCIHCGYRP